MRFVIAGASGFLGSAWSEHLRRDGHQVVALVRRPPQGEQESRWDPYAGRLDPAVIEDADVVANLAGAPLAHWPWTSAYKRTFRDSRIVTTRVLAEAIAGSTRKPAFLAQNGISGYGDRDDLVLTEDSDADASTYLGRITQEWLRATAPAADAGARVVVMRSGIVLHRSGSALKPLLLLFRAGLGGPLASGEQYFSTISLTDWLRAATFLATHPECEGVYNVSGPNPTTNAEFTRELARQVHRPAVLRAPAWPLRKLAPDVSSELLGSARVEPRRLLEAGFAFEHPTLNDRLTAALS